MSLSSELEVTLSAGPYNDLVISVSVISPKAGEPAEASQKLITDYWLLITWAGNQFLLRCAS
jgi:hypothetical protein